mgnify:CR=1 FL=1
MDQAQHNAIASFIWSIADDVLHQLIEKFLDASIRPDLRHVPRL